MGVFGNIKGLSYYTSKGETDPYITLSNPNEEDVNLEHEELEILPSDNLLVSAKTADEVSLLEVHVYENPDLGAFEDQNEYEGNLYVHHDTLLPAMPLCLEWGDSRPSTSKGESTGNFVAVGTMDKQIEVWDLDLIDGLFPEAVLGDEVEGEGGEGDGKKEPHTSMEVEFSKSSVGLSNGMQEAENISILGTKQKKKKKKSKLPSASTTASVSILQHAHTDSVLSLSWNRTHRSLLASGSADGSIKLWDLTSSTCQRAIRSFDIHGGKKVQSIQWNSREPTVLLSGAWEGGIKIFDTRNPDASIGCNLPGPKADVEAVHWDPHSSTGAHFFVSTGKGQVLYYDSRNLEKPLWTLDAHDGPVAALDVNEYISGCIVTGGIDKQVKVWSISSRTALDNKPGGASKGKISISLVVSRDLGVGKVFSTLWSPNDPTTMAVAGSNAKLTVWDAWTNQGFRRIFKERVKGLESMGLQEEGKRAKAKGIVSVDEDYEPDSAGED